MLVRGLVAWGRGEGRAARAEDAEERRERRRARAEVRSGGGGGGGWDGGGRGGASIGADPTPAEEGFEAEMRRPSAASGGGEEIGRGAARRDYAVWSFDARLIGNRRCGSLIEQCFLLFIFSTFLLIISTEYIYIAPSHSIQTLIQKFQSVSWVKK